MFYLASWFNKYVKNLCCDYCHGNSLKTDEVHVQKYKFVYFECSIKIKSKKSWYFYVASKNPRPFIQKWWFKNSSLDFFKQKTIYSLMIHMYME